MLSVRVRDARCAAPPPCHSYASFSANPNGSRARALKCLRLASEHLDKASLQPIACGMSGLQLGRLGRRLLSLGQQVERPWASAALQQFSSTAEAAAGSGTAAGEGPSSSGAQRAPPSGSSAAGQGAFRRGQHVRLGRAAACCRLPAAACSRPAPFLYVSCMTAAFQRICAACVAWALAQHALVVLVEAVLRAFSCPSQASTRRTPLCVLAAASRGWQQAAAGRHVAAAGIRGQATGRPPGWRTLRGPPAPPRRPRPPDKRPRGLLDLPSCCAP